MNKLAQLINELPVEDVEKIRLDVKKGTLLKVIDNRIKQARKERLTLCPVCNTPVQEGLGWYLEFGSQSLRKKATFDSPDCLAYFVTKREVR